MSRPRCKPIIALVAIAGACALGPATLAGTLAAAAGSLFEAAPFVLAAEVLPRRVAPLAVVVGCGCSRRLPGTLSLAATALCWLTFGPAIALARFAAGLVIAVALRRHAGGEDAAPFAGGLASRRSARQAAVPAADPFAELLGVGAGAALAALLSRALAASAASLGGRAPALDVGLGAALGLVAPCATAAVAIAAALAPHAPLAAASVLATGGLVPQYRLFEFRRLSSRVEKTTAPAVARLALALALAALAARGPSGLVNPRLVPFVAAGAGLALAGLARSSGSGRRAAVVPAVMLAALVGGSPLPPSTATATQLDAAYPGELLEFTGIARERDGATILERFAITCCRADASAIDVRAVGLPPRVDGTWVWARGRLAASPRGLVLQATRWHRVASPVDPFVYR